MNFNKEIKNTHDEIMKLHDQLDKLHENITTKLDLFEIVLKENIIKPNIEKINKIEVIIPKNYYSDSLLYSFLILNICAFIFLIKK